MVSISVCGVTKRFGETVVLSHVDLEVDDGQWEEGGSRHEIRWS